MKKLKNFRCFLRNTLVAAAALAMFSLPVLAQENVVRAEPEKQSPKQEQSPDSKDTETKTPPIAESEKNTEANSKAESNQAADSSQTVETNRAETTLARNFFRPASLDAPKSREFLFTKKSVNIAPESEQQTGDQDDTMMGVMGKGTDSIKLGGHVGFVVPIVGRGNGVTTNLGDRFVFGFPVGLTLKTKKNIAIDFEFIPTFNTGRDFVLTIHPGIIYGFAKKYAVGVRAAYDAGAGSFGFTPLISRGFKINDKVGFFVEADFPIRSNYNPYRDRFGSIAFAAHAGFAF